MENPENVKRSIRIPRDMNREIKEIAKEEGISANKKIINIIKIYMEERVSGSRRKREI